VLEERVAEWTGCHADCLRQALRMTNESFAEHLGIAVRTVAYWRQRPALVPRSVMQQDLDTALALAPEPARAQFWRLQAQCQPAHPDSGVVLLEPDDAAGLTEWLTATATSDEAIDGLDRTVSRLAEAHALAAPAAVLTEVRQAQATAQALLRNGKMRHRQERELLRINGGLLSHMSLLLGDLGDDRRAEEYGNAALLYLREAGASEVTAWYVLAKTARWRQLYLHAADLASEGVQRSSPGPMRVQLACYEANAAALAGDTGRASRAMRYAEEAATAVPTGQVTLSPWSFPDERMTIFRVSVALGTHDPAGALRAAADWDTDQATARPYVQAAWAQIRVGAGIAHLLTDSLDGTAEEVAPVLALPPEFRIVTVTGWLADLGRRLAAGRYATSPLAADLRQQIREFAATSATARRSKEGSQQ